MEKTRTRGKYNKQNQSALKHGGAAALEKVKRGQPFIGLAAAEEQRVIAEYELTGVLELEKQTAIRLQTVQNLYWDAINKAAQDGDLVALDRYVARYGWLAGVSLRAWAQVQQQQGQDMKNNQVIDVLAALKGGTDG
jgi:hypothetical protein